MKVVLAFDSFKGSLTASQAVTTAAEGILSAMPDAEIVPLPMADGGEGTTDVLCHYMQAETVSCVVSDPLFKPITARYAISRDGHTAIMEMASAAGLTLVPAEQQNPLKTTTYGVGEMIADAARRDCQRVLLGIGGSATTDCGMGMLAALGAKFRDSEGQLLAPIGESMKKVAFANIDNIHTPAIEVVCDVDNPLFGANGAACVYAPQKGASAHDVALLDEGLRHFASLFPADPSTPGAGAAGGLGFGLMLIGATLRKGIDVVLDTARIDDHLQGADLVITGEGKIDRQTLCGKLPLGVMQRAHQHGVPTIAVAGAVEDEAELLAAGFHRVVAITPPGTPLHEAMRTDVASKNLRRTTARLFA